MPPPRVFALIVTKRVGESLWKNPKHNITTLPLERDSIATDALIRTSTYKIIEQASANNMKFFSIDFIKGVSSNCPNAKPTSAFGTMQRTRGGGPISDLFQHGPADTKLGSSLLPVGCSSTVSEKKKNEKKTTSFMFQLITNHEREEVCNNRRLLTPSVRHCYRPLKR
jgi:hypothetical protein